MIQSLALLLVAAVVYSGGVTTSFAGLLFALLNLALAVMDRVAQRRLLTTECQGLSTESCMLLNNLLGSIPTAALGFFLREHTNFDTTLWFRSSATILLILS